MKVSLISALALSSALSIWAYKRSVCKSKLYFQQNNQETREIIGKCNSLHSKFWPVPFSTGPYLQTIIPSFIRKDIEIPFTRELFILSDDGTVALDWWENEEKEQNAQEVVILVCPGLTGTSKTKYVIQSINHLMKTLPNKEGTTKISIVVFNYRGNAGAPLTVPRSYNGADTEDLREVVSHVMESRPNSLLFAIGYSLGSNILTKYIGEEGENCRIKAAVSISNPFNFNESTNFWCGWKFEYLLGTHLTRFLKQNLIPHIDYFKNAGFPIDREDILKCRTVQEFDERFTIIVGGWKTVEEYYNCASSDQFLKFIRIPVLFINAEDDPLSPACVAPFEEFEKNPKIILVHTPLGGHIGWCQLHDPRGPAFYDPMASDFFAIFLQE